MKKIINQTDDILDEMLNGFVQTHSDLVERLDGTDVIVRKEKKENKVALVSGGGSGHEPSHAGFVGEGMLDAAVCGAVFTSPTPDQILEAIKAVDSGRGVFLIIKNYSGDVMNFEMAKDLAEMEDIEVDYVIVDDDIAVKDSTYTAGRRGVAGTILVHKILGAFAERGASLSEIKECADALVKNIKTLGFALLGATVPAVGKPGFELGEDEIELGVGIHGEPGYQKSKLLSSHGLASELVEKLNEEMHFDKNKQYGCLINGLGATPLMEQYIFANDTYGLLKDAGVTLEFHKLGNYMTALDMTGLSLTLIELNDSWLAALSDRANTPAWSVAK